jgi:hypothetical protein
MYWEFDSPSIRCNLQVVGTMVNDQSRQPVLCVGAFVRTTHAMDDDRHLLL